MSNKTLVQKNNTSGRQLPAAPTFSARAMRHNRDPPRDLRWHPAVPCLRFAVFHPALVQLGSRFFPVFTLSLSDLSEALVAKKKFPVDALHPVEATLEPLGGLYSTFALFSPYMHASLTCYFGDR